MHPDVTPALDAVYRSDWGRIVAALIRLFGRPGSLPETSELPARLDAVLTVIYLVFNEGYAATQGEPLVRADLCAEAIRLGRLVHTLMAPGPPSATSCAASVRRPAPTPCPVPVAQAPA
jgi:hypothetical protein